MNATVASTPRRNKKKLRLTNIARDAVVLGVHREHLRLVAIGQRASPQLLRRYLTLLEQTNPQLKEKIMARFHPHDIAPESGKIPGHDPAEDSLSWEYICKVLTPLGFVVCAVEVAFDKEALEHAGLGFEQVIGVELQTAELGHFDSLRQAREEKKFLLFYLLHRRSLDEATKFLIKALDTRRLLPHCKISTATPAEKCWGIIHLPGAAPI